MTQLSETIQALSLNKHHCFLNTTGVEGNVVTLSKSFKLANSIGFKKNQNVLFIIEINKMKLFVLMYNFEFNCKIQKNCSF